MQYLSQQWMFLDVAVCTVHSTPPDSILPAPTCSDSVTDRLGSPVIGRRHASVTFGLPSTKLLPSPSTTYYLLLPKRLHYRLYNTFLLSNRMVYHTSMLHLQATKIHLNQVARTDLFFLEKKKKKLQGRKNLRIESSLLFFLLVGI